MYNIFLSFRFVMYDNFSELVRKSTPFTFLFRIYRLCHHKMLFPIGPVAEEF